MTSDLRIDPALRSFVDDELLPGLDIEPERFWAALVDLQGRFAGRIAALLARRDELQEQVDAWHREHGAGDPDAYAAFLTEIGYLVPDTTAHLSVTGVDAEIAEVAGPQLVVPATVPRYALNAANARWGSLYDALLRHRRAPAGPRPRAGLRRAARRPGDRGRRRAARRAVPARRGQPRRRHGVPRRRTGALVPALADPAQFAGSADARDPAAPPRAARRADDQPGVAGRAPAPRGRRRRRAGVGGHHDRRPRGLGRHRRRRGQGERLPHLARPHDRQRSRRRSRRAGRRSSASCTATAATPLPTAHRSCCRAARCCSCATAGTT